MFAHKSSLHTYLDKAKTRIDDMDAALASLERVTRKAQARAKAGKLIADLKKRRNSFADNARQMKAHVTAAEARMKKLSVAGATSFSAFRVALARSRKAFGRANRVAGKAVRRAVK
jgi:hypothetical protein